MLLIYVMWSCSGISGATFATSHDDRNSLRRSAHAEVQEIVGIIIHIPGTCAAQRQAISRYELDMNSSSSESLDRQLHLFPLTIFLVRHTSWRSDKIRESAASRALWICMNLWKCRLLHAFTCFFYESSSKLVAPSDPLWIPFAQYKY